MKITKQTAKPGFPELRGSIEHIQYPAWGEIKYDGEFCYIIYTTSQLGLINKYGTVREDFPALNTIGIALQKKCKASILLAELYFEEGKLQIAGEMNSNKENDNLNIKVYDVLQIDGADLTNEPLVERKEVLADLLGPLTIDGTVLNDRAAAEEFFNEMVQAGFEGVVLKNLNSKLAIGPCDWAKMKHKDRTDYEVRVVDPVLERIEVDVPHATKVEKDGRSLKVNVGVKAVNRYKKHIKAGDTVTIEHQGVMASGSLKHPVLIPKPEWK